MTDEAVQRASDIAEIRLNVGDRPATESDRLFSDADLGVFLDREECDVNRATARTLRVIAGNYAMVLKKIDRDGLKTDGPAVAAELRQLADEFDAMSAPVHEILRTDADVARQETDDRDEIWTRWRERDLDRRYGAYYG